jgi:hypothetical protein
MTENRNVSLAHVYTASVPESLLLRLEDPRKRLPPVHTEIHHTPVKFQPYESLPTRLCQAMLGCRP